MGHSKKDIPEEMLNSFNFNDNRLVAIDIRTMGTHIHEICMYPLNNKFELAKSVIPFYSYFIPTIKMEESGYTLTEYAKACSSGISRSTGFEIFERWCKHKLKLFDGRKIMPLTYDWAAKRPFFIDWMGPINFNNYFHFQVRDILSMALFGNDFANMQYERCPYPKVDMPYIFSQTKTNFNRKDTLVNAVGIAKVYRWMLTSYFKYQIPTA